jgi:hypothetical protein
MASVEAFNPLSITGVIMIPDSGKHCIVRAAPSCSDFLVALSPWSAQRVDKQAFATAKYFLGDPDFLVQRVTVDHPLHLNRQH